MRTLEDLDNHRHSMFQFVLTAISSAIERMTHMMNHAVVAQFDVRSEHSCERLDAMSTLCNTCTVDMISDMVWIEEWAKQVEDVGDGILRQMLDTSENVFWTCVRSNIIAVAQIEWFHTVQHAIQKGEEPDFSKLRIGKTVEETLAEKDPEMALMVDICDWLADYAEIDKDAYDIDRSEGIAFIYELVDDIKRFVRPMIKKRADAHTEVFSDLERGVIDQKQARERLDKVMPGLIEEQKQSRINRGNQAAKQMEEEDDKTNPIKALVRELARKLVKKEGGSAAIVGSDGTSEIIESEDEEKSD